MPVREFWRNGNEVNGRFFEGGGRFVTSLVLWRCFFFTTVTQQKQITFNHLVLFMLPLEVVGPGGSLSAELYSNPTISVRRQSERILAGRNGDAAYSCDWTVAALVFWLEGGRR
jgi:hypothetical protein